MSVDAEAAALGRPRSRRMRTSLAVVVVAALAVAAFFVVKSLTGGEGKGGTLEGSAGNAFTIKYPESWRPLSAGELDALPGRPLSVLRRKDGKGFLVVRRDKRPPPSFDTFSGELTGALTKRIPDFQKRTSKVVSIRAGKAFFYSYIRKRKGTVHTVVIVPAGKRSYVLNTVSQGGASDVARQIAKMILSFDV